MDLDVFVAAHRAEWDRLDQLQRRRRRLTGAEADEMVALYQRTATHLSMLRAQAPDPVVMNRLTTLVARARSGVVGARRSTWGDAVHYFTAGFPAACYRTRTWWVPTAFAFILVTVLVGWWIAASPEVQASIGAPEELREMTRPGGAYETYYTESAAAAFSAQVWTNNAWVAAISLAFGVLLGIPVIWVLLLNAVNVGIGLGLMAAAGRLDVFLGLILPHGLLELTAVFVAAGVGLRLGWTVIDPGPRSRRVALATEGRAALGMAIGLMVVLFVSGLIEGFVTPSGLPTWARITIGVVALVAFLLYVFVVGRRAAEAGETGDTQAADVGDRLPEVA
ncbi:stage II sporulation protein M [Streptomyces calidiresistens]|uniref:Stage II sporulation protein M n=1 Tax=Streptomyces calidiresistens TaxID=1485586 RepID=A0A7W3T6U6_9ACTN|nr:stage II sporulation protein M [Streptomyces calidiresistens]MBB0232023.1 stage II sporulation protein M [Streptomyces calidiresistens]